MIRALKNSLDAFKDETPLSIMVLRLPEFMFGLSDSVFQNQRETICLSGNYCAHPAGALIYLFLCRLNQLSTPHGRWLFNAIFRGETSRVFMACQEEEKMLWVFENALDRQEPTWIYSLLAFYRSYYRVMCQVRANVAKLDLDAQEYQFEIQQLENQAANIGHGHEDFWEANRQYLPKPVV